MEPPVTRFQEQRSYCHFGYDRPCHEPIQSLVPSVLTTKRRSNLFMFSHWEEVNLGGNFKALPRNSFQLQEEQKGKKRGETVLLSFDIRSERFGPVWAPESMLRAVLSIGIAVNHLGKLGFIGRNRIGTSYE